jgi:hypothetical protein
MFLAERIGWIVARAEVSGRREIRYIARGGRVEIDFAFLYQFQSDGVGEELAYRIDGKSGAGRHRRTISGSQERLCCLPVNE